MRSLRWAIRWGQHWEVFFSCGSSIYNIYSVGSVRSGECPLVNALTLLHQIYNFVFQKQKGKNYVPIQKDKCILCYVKCKNKLYSSTSSSLVFLGPAFLFFPPEPEVSMSVGISPALLHCCPFFSKVDWFKTSSPGSFLWPSWAAESPIPVPTTSGHWDSPVGKHSNIPSEIEGRRSWGRISLLWLPKVVDLLHFFTIAKSPRRMHGSYGASQGPGELVKGIVSLALEKTVSEQAISTMYPGKVGEVESRKHSTDEEIESANPFIKINRMLLRARIWMNKFPTYG